MRLETYIDDDFLERPDSPDKLREAIADQCADLETLRETLADEPSELERTRLGRTLNRLSNYLRLEEACDEACRYCEEAIEIWKSLGRDRATYLARLRLAAIELRRDNLEAARRLADELVDEAADEPFAVYRDFALELRGRIHARAGEYKKAARDLERAVELRRRDGRDRLAERTEGVLENVYDRL